MNWNAVGAAASIISAFGGLCSLIAVWWFAFHEKKAREEAQNGIDEARQLVERNSAQYGLELISILGAKLSLFVDPPAGRLIIPKIFEYEITSVGRRIDLLVARLDHRTELGNLLSECGRLADVRYISEERESVRTWWCKLRIEELAVIEQQIVDGWDVRRI